MLKLVSARRSLEAHALVPMLTHAGLDSERDYHFDCFLFFSGLFSCHSLFTDLSQPASAPLPL